MDAAPYLRARAKCRWWGWVTAASPRRGGGLTGFCPCLLLFAAFVSEPMASREGYVRKRTGSEEELVLIWIRERIDRLACALAGLTRGKRPHVAVRLPGPRPGQERPHREGPDSHSFFRHWPTYPRQSSSATLRISLRAASHTATVG